MTGLALDDVRVLDLTHHLCGPYATKLLADHGADVIKIERPTTGDVARRLGPFPTRSAAPPSASAGERGTQSDGTDDGSALRASRSALEESGIFAYLNTNKRSVTLNLASGEGRAVFFQLLETADIVVENFRPGVMDELGIGYPELSRRKPGIVLLSISNFGQTGPYRDWAGSELVLFAMGGEMYSMGMAEREPIKMAGTAALFQSASAAAVAAMGAIYGSRWGAGGGDHLDISIYETQTGGVDRRHATIIAYQFGGRVSGRVPIGAVLGYPNGVYLCSDGYVELTGGGSRWAGTLRMLGNPPELSSPEWQDPNIVMNPARREEFDTIFIPWLLERSKVEVWHAAQEQHLLCAPLYSVEDLFNDPVFHERGFFIEMDHPAMGRITMPGRPFVMSASPWTLRRPAPLLGQHTDEVLHELGYDDARIQSLRASGVV